MADAVNIYTDGACRGNPGPGGWGVLLEYRGVEKELFGGVREPTTNNRMELLAAIKGLEALKRNSTVRLHTDSTYVQKGVTEWLETWKRKNWMTASRTPVKNKDLWMRLDAAMHGHKIQWKWVRGHAGHSGNERADLLANRGIDTIGLHGSNTGLA
ncbi:MAG: ribonuclease HI [Methylococcaceae bacterium]|nr:ribonuclease HI [Methylococcaceae bacterium]